MRPEDTPLLETDWAALDFESGGAAPGAAEEPVQVGIVVWRRGGEGPGEFFRSFIRPSRAITRPAREVHGIGDAETANAPEMGSLWPEFRQRMKGAVMLAHGAGTERRFLRAFPFHGFGPWIDTLAVSRALLPGLSDHSLSGVVTALGVERTVRALCPSLDWHDALFDAVACAVVLRQLSAEGGLGGMTVSQVAALDATAYHRHRRLKRAARDAGWDSGIA